MATQKITYTVQEDMKGRNYSFAKGDKITAEEFRGLGKLQNQVKITRSKVKDEQKEASSQSTTDSSTSSEKVPEEKKTETGGGKKK